MLIRERTDKHGLIRVNHYGCSFKVISELVEEVKKDFPTLIDEDINVVKYGGVRYKGTFGVEFKLPNSGDRQFLSKYRMIKYFEKLV